MHITSGSVGCSSLFLPSDIGVDSWWDADSPNGSMSSLPNDDTPLEQVNDLGLKQNNFIQTTPINQPIYKRAIMNGHNIFRFNGSSHFMVCTAGSSNNYQGPLTIMAIASSGSIAGVARLLSKSAPGGYSAGRAGNLSRFTTWAVKDFDTAPQWTIGAFQVVTYVLKPGWSVDLYKNANFIQNITGGGPGISTQPLYFGTASGSTEFWNGDIQVLFLFFRVLADWELDLMHRYCLTRIGL